MEKVLLVIESEEYGRSISRDLQQDYIPLLCHSADTALQLMNHKPDAMILELSLPGMDGMSLLEKVTWRPPVILTMAPSYSAYETQKLIDLGVGYRLRTPCSLRAVTERLRDMMHSRSDIQNDAQSIAAKHLRKLGISPIDGGGKQLRIAIPLYAQDRQQKISAELYPTVAHICGSTVSGVEKSMGRTIRNAWNHRDPECWEEYFPQGKRHPSNKEFLTALAEKLG